MRPTLTRKQIADVLREFRHLSLAFKAESQILYYGDDTAAFVGGKGYGFELAADAIREQLRKGKT
jgi:hypothetical protein